jgi:type II secretory pathway pseudopilin PulG
VRARASKEDGFGMIELLFAMVLLNVGIFALVATFQSGALALNRSAATSNGSAVADKVMEVYRSLQNKAIYLDAPSGGGSDTSGYPNGIPNSTSTWYAAYSADTSAYLADPVATGGTAYYSYANPANSPFWVTQATTGTSYVPIPASSSTVLPAGLTDPNPTKAVQAVTGPDGQTYPVFTYIIMVKPSGTGWTAGYVKQVTVVVRDPRQTSRVLARQSAYFDPNVAP